MPGLVMVTEYSKPEDNTFKNYINYIDRKETLSQNNGLAGSYDTYLNYMAEDYKATGLFTNDYDVLTEPQKKAMKNTYEEAQRNDSLLWQTVISFDNQWLKEMGIYDDEHRVLDERKLKNATRKSINALLEKENLKNATWSGAIHYNTDNIHIHVATCEVNPMRKQKKYVQYEREKVDGKWIYKKELNPATGRYEKVPMRNQQGEVIKKQEYVGKFQQASIRNAKSIFANELLNNKELNIEINDIIRNQIVAGKKERNLLKDTTFSSMLNDLYQDLGKNVNPSMWNYKANIMKPYRPTIDKISQYYIETYHKDDFSRLEAKLEMNQKRYEATYGKSYGKEKMNTFYSNKMDDLYYRLGNSILLELKNDNKKTDQVKKNLQGTRPILKKENLQRINDNVLFHLKRSLKKQTESWRNQVDYEMLQQDITTSNPEI